MARLGEATKMVLPPMDLQPEDKVRAALGLEEPPRVIRAMLNCRERQLLDYQTRVIALERALREAFNAMNYMGDILNGMDAAPPTDVAKVAPAFAIVRAALEGK